MSLISRDVDALISEGGVGDVIGGGVGGEGRLHARTSGGHIYKKKVGVMPGVMSVHSNANTNKVSRTTRLSGAVSGVSGDVVIKTAVGVGFRVAGDV